MNLTQQINRYKCSITKDNNMHRKTKSTSRRSKAYVKELRAQIPGDAGLYQEDNDDATLHETTEKFSAAKNKHIVVYKFSKPSIS